MATEGLPAQERGWLRFGLSSLLIAVGVLALALGWWRDHREQLNRIASLEEEVDYFKHFEDEARESRRGRWSRGGIPRKFKNAEQFIKFLLREPDRDLFEGSREGFIATPDAQDAIPQLVALMNDAGAETRWRAVSTLCVMKARPDVVVPVLVLQLKSNDMNASCQALESLSVYGPPTPDMLHAVREVASDNASPMAASAAYNLHQWDSTFDAGGRLLELLDSDLEAHRSMAAQYLPRCASAAVARWALELRLENEQNDYVRGYITRSLKSLDGKQGSAE